MKTPIYEISGGALRALLASRRFAYADLYTFELIDGTTLRYTNADVNIGFSGNVWDSHSVRFDDPNNKALGSWKVGLDVSTWQVQVFPRVRDQVTGSLYPDTIGSIPWLQAVTGGALDAATITIDRAYLPNWSQPPVFVEAPTGVYRIFVGRTAAIDNLRGGIVLNINSLVDLLSIQLPRNQYQVLCIHRLFDAGCQLSSGSYANAGTVASGSSGVTLNTTIAAPNPSPPNSGTYVLGSVVMTSGANNGLFRSIKSWLPGTGFSLVAPFYFALAPGDTFNAFPGCDRTLQNCQAFNNDDNYGGTLYVPQAEQAI